jgi:hypothetical protein
VKQALLDTGSATLGTDITSEYVNELPLINRSFFGLTFLAAGVTEVAGSGTRITIRREQTSLPTGSATRPPRYGWTAPDQRAGTGRGRKFQRLLRAPGRRHAGNESQNNSFSAEFGNNGGTVVNMVMKSGTNAFHGSGWYFLQRPQMDARDFFNPEPNPKPDPKRDQGGFSARRPDQEGPHFLLR